MFNNLARQLLFVTICIHGVAMFTQASPINYEFSGTLTQPYNGSTQFSGTFTYDTSLPLSQLISATLPGWSYYAGTPTDPAGSPESLTLNVGNGPPLTFGGVDTGQVIVTHTGQSDGFFVYGFNFGAHQNLFAEFAAVNNNLATPGPFSSTALPSSLNLADFNTGANLSFYGQRADGQSINFEGTVMSLVRSGSDAQSGNSPGTDDQTGNGSGTNAPDTPEPSSILTFIVAAAGFARLLRAGGRHRSRGGWGA